LREKFGIRGKFTILPYPAGLGSILEGWEGVNKEEIDRWLKIAHQRIAPLFDITPEILTHTLALDLDTMQLLPFSENEWSQQQNEETLTKYIAFAFQILKEAGFDATGVTSPCDFCLQIENIYARAILNAQRKVYKRNHSWYFLHTDTNPQGRQSQISYRENTATVISIVSTCGDYLWQSMEINSKDEAYIHQLADFYLSEDGASGQLTILLKAGIPIVFHTHWQSLYSNGKYSGISALKIVAERISSLWADKVEWMKCSKLAEVLCKEDFNRK